MYVDDGTATGIRIQSMEEVKAAAAEEVEEKGASCAKVMTDEQMEVLRTQISAYATICEQLVQMHRARQDYCSPFGMLQPNSLHKDLLMSPGAAKISSRQQRWNPTPKQLQILESIFYHGNGTPSKQTIKDISCQLSQHGQISETNVYNWFQNRRARSKRKQTMTEAGATFYNDESEGETGSSNEKKARSVHNNLSAPADEHSYRCSDVNFGSEGMHA